MYKERYKSHHDADRGLKDKFEIKTNLAKYVQGVLDSSPKAKRTIYLHVPFCSKRCTFCMFNKPLDLSLKTYDDYLINEIEKIKSFNFKYFEAPIHSIYFGGGTPTSLNTLQLERVLKALHRNFNIDKGAEISLETSVTELTSDKLKMMIDNGVNRISVGIQTFNNEGRRRLGRRGSGQKGVEKLEEALKLGLKNTNIDLIYNYPGQTFADLKEDINIIKSLPLAGLSFYSLTLHEKAPIQKQITFEERDDMSSIAREKEYFDYIVKELEKYGYKPFELTKLVRNGIDRYEYIRIRHTEGCCIPIGHGAGGNLENYFFRNSSKIENISKDIPFSSMGRVLSPKYRKLDRFVNDMQKISVDLEQYSKALNIDMEHILKDILLRLESDNLIKRKGSKIKLTHDGLFWGNNIIDELIKAIIQSSEIELDVY